MHRRMLTVAVLASLATAGPVAAAQGASSGSKATQGVVFGGVIQTVVDGLSAPGFPVVIRLSKTGSKVLSANIGLDVKCQMPPDLTIPDSVENIKVSASGKFRADQPVQRTDANPAKGLPAFDTSATITGTVNKARTLIKGTWQRKVVIYNPADPTNTQILDTCDTGVVRYTARN